MISLYKYLTDFSVIYVSTIMLRVVSLLVFLRVWRVVCDIYDDNFEEFRDSWAYRSAKNYNPKYNMFGAMEEDWSIIPAVPYEDRQTNPAELPPKFLRQSFTKKHFNPNFMSINTPDYKNFKFVHPLDSFTPPYFCNYPNISQIIEQNPKFLNFADTRMVLKTVSLCPVDYYWLDFGYNQYPRYILQGFCRNKTTITSIPCKPCESTVYSVLRNICFDGRCQWTQMDQNRLTWCTQF